MISCQWESGGELRVASATAVRMDANFSRGEENWVRRLRRFSQIRF